MRAYSLLSFLVILGLFFPGGVSSSRADLSANPATPEAGIGNIRLELLSRHNGTINAVAISGNYAYIDSAGRLAVVDISDKAHPQIIGQSEVLFSAAKDIQLSGNYAYIAAGTEGLFIVNIATPTAPYQSRAPAPKRDRHDLGCHEQRNQGQLCLSCRVPGRGAGDRYFYSRQPV